MSRLARALDCEGYEELRDICRAEFKRPFISLSERAGTLQEKSDKRKSEKNPFLLDQTTSAAEGIQELINAVDIEALRLLSTGLCKPGAWLLSA